MAPTKLYLVGYYHLSNELDPLETKELAELLDRWRDRIVVTTTIPFLQLFATTMILRFQHACTRRFGPKRPRGSSARRYRASSRIIAAAFSAIIAVGVLVLPDVIVGITEASATRRPAMP